MMTQSTNLAGTIDSTDFHDATFLRALVVWSTASVELSFNLSRHDHAEARISVFGLTRFECPRQSPWGESVSVNEVRVSNGGNSSLLVEIEMQSGDTIRAEGASVSIAFA